jgi:hypothetical protein
LSTGKLTLSDGAKLKFQQDTKLSLKEGASVVTDRNSYIVFFTGDEIENEPAVAGAKTTFEVLKEISAWIKTGTDDPDYEPFQVPATGERTDLDTALTFRTTHKDALALTADTVTGNNTSVAAAQLQYDTDLSPIVRDFLKDAAAALATRAANIDTINDTARKITDVRTVASQVLNPDATPNPITSTSIAIDVLAKVNALVYIVPPYADTADLYDYYVNKDLFKTAANITVNDADPAITTASGAAVSASKTAVKALADTHKDLKGVFGAGGAADYATVTVPSSGGTGPGAASTGDVKSYILANLADKAAAEADQGKKALYLGVNVEVAATDSDLKNLVTFTYNNVKYRVKIAVDAVSSIITSEEFLLMSEPDGDTPAPGKPVITGTLDFAIATGTSSKFIVTTIRYIETPTDGDPTITVNPGTEYKVRGGRTYKVEIEAETIGAFKFTGITGTTLADASTGLTDTDPGHTQDGFDRGIRATQSNGGRNILIEGLYEWIDNYLYIDGPVDADYASKFLAAPKVKGVRGTSGTYGAGGLVLYGTSLAIGTLNTNNFILTSTVSLPPDALIAPTPEGVGVIVLGTSAVTGTSITLINGGQLTAGGLTFSAGTTGTSTLTKGVITNGTLSLAIDAQIGTLEVEGVASVASVSSGNTVTLTKVALTGPATVNSAGTVTVAPDGILSLKGGENVVAAGSGKVILNTGNGNTNELRGGTFETSGTVNFIPGDGTSAIKGPNAGISTLKPLGAAQLGLASTSTAAINLIIDVSAGTGTGGLKFDAPADEQDAILSLHSTAGPSKLILTTGSKYLEAGAVTGTGNAYGYGLPTTAVSEGNRDTGIYLLATAGTSDPNPYSAGAASTGNRLIVGTSQYEITSTGKLGSPKITVASGSILLTGTNTNISSNSAILIGDEID